MSIDCTKQIKYPRKISRLPKKFKDKLINEVFKEQKSKVNEEYEKKKSEKTNHTLLLTKVNNLCDSSGRRKIRKTASLPGKKSKGVSQPYMDFINGTERHIISWKSSLLPSLTEVVAADYTICELVDMRVEQIIKEFTDFWTELGSNCSDEEKAKNAETMRRMFDVDFDEHLSRALVSIPRELMCVPTQVATANCQPEAAISNILKKIVMCDIEAEAEPKRIVGFGTSLPKELTSFPPKNNTRQRWMDIDAIPPEIINMSTVWEGITNLKSTLDYYNWTTEKWNRDTPQYLRSVYKSTASEEPLCEIRDLMEKYQISETMLPVLREEKEDIENLKKKAFADV